MCTDVAQKLDAALGTVEAVGLRNDSPVVATAEELRETLQVCMQGLLRFMTVWVRFRFVFREFTRICSDRLHFYVAFLHEHVELAPNPVSRCNP